MRYGVRIEGGDRMGEKWMESGMEEKQWRRER
jgi:protease II